LLVSGDEINSKQLRDDLMTMLIAGHETTAAGEENALYFYLLEASLLQYRNGASGVCTVDHLANR
jgi:beta-ring hydroxylase